MGAMAVMDQTGDTKSIWDAGNPDEVEAARDQFNKLKRKGYVAYRVGEDGKATEVMREFDPRAEKVILRPQAAGG